MIVGCVGQMITCLWAVTHLQRLNAR